MTYENALLGDVAVFFNNQRKPITRAARVPGKYPYYGAAGIQDYVEGYLFDGEFILVGEDGTVITGSGSPVVQRAAGKFWVNNHAHVIRPKDEEDFDFLFYAVANGNIEDLVSGAVQPKLSMTNLKQLQIPWPQDSRIRRAIGVALRTLDRKSENNSEIAATLEVLAETFFKSWFIDFDPVKAKMTGEAPVGMDAETAALFPDSMEESELGEIPSGWRVANIAELGKVVTGKTPSTKQPSFWGEDIPFVTIPDMHNTSVISSTARYLSTEGARSQKSQSLPAGSTLVSCIASPGLVSFTFDPCHTNQQINSVIPSDWVEPAWLYFNLKALVPRIIQRSAVGTMFANLNKSSFSSIASVLPPHSVIAAFEKFGFEILNLMRVLQNQSGALSAIRDALIPRLISGELEIPEEMLAA